MLPSIEHDLKVNVCGGSGSTWRNCMMPNSAVTIDRLWLSYQNNVGLPDRIKELEAFYSTQCGPLGSQYPARNLAIAGRLKPAMR